METGAQTQYCVATMESVYYKTSGVHVLYPSDDLSALHALKTPIICNFKSVDLYVRSLGNS